MRVHRSTQICDVHRPVKIVHGVFLARPGQLHRLTTAIHRHTHRLADKIHVQTPPKAAAQQGHVQGDVVDADTRDVSRYRARHLRHLGRRPHFDLAIFDPRGAVHRLHRGVGEKRGLVGRRDHTRGFALHLNRIALFEEGKTVFYFQCGVQLDFNLLRIQRALHALLPLHVHRLRTLAGVPGRFANHSDTRGRAANRVQFHQPLNAQHGHRCLVVNRSGRAADHGAQPHCGKQHAGQAHVHAKLRGAVNLGGDVQPRCGLPDQLPILAVLQRDFAGCHAACGLRQVAVMR